MLSLVKRSKTTLKLHFQIYIDYLFTLLAYHYVLKFLNSLDLATILGCTVVGALTVSKSYKLHFITYKAPIQASTLLQFLSRMFDIGHPSLVGWIVVAVTNSLRALQERTTRFVADKVP